MSRTIPVFLKKILTPKKEKVKSDKSIPTKEILKKKKKEVVEIIFEDSSSDDEYDIPENPSGCKVVKIARKGGKIDVDCDIYIGRRCTMGGWNLSDSKWYNPFKVDQNNDIHKVLRDFEFYMKTHGDYGQKNLMNDLHELKGKVLGCWCKKKGNEPCHGDILVKLLNEQIICEKKKVHEMERIREENRIKEENSDKAMVIYNKFLEEKEKMNVEKKESDKLERMVEEEKLKTENDNLIIRRKKVVEKYGENHEMASQCKDRHKTRQIKTTSRPLIYDDFDKSGDIKHLDVIEDDIHPITECRSYDERDHCAMSMETQSLPPREETIDDLIDEME